MPLQKRFHRIYKYFKICIWINIRLRVSLKLKLEKFCKLVYKINFFMNKIILNIYYIFFISININNKNLVKIQTIYKLLLIRLINLE